MILANCEFEAVERGFFEEPVLSLARSLIGAVIVSATAGQVTAGKIVETEAYRGPEDLAAHSRRGLRTKRTEVMFGPPGHAYMFLLYGSSWAFNIVAGALGFPHAVLVRAVEPLVGLKTMAARRKVSENRRELSNGPGKLCQALGLDKRHNGADLSSGDLCIAKLANPRASKLRVGRSARINIDYAGAWKTRPWRFFEAGNRYVSVPPRE